MEAAREAELRNDESLRGLLRRIARRRLLLAAVALTVFAGVAAWTFLATPRYRSRAVLRIESKSATPALPDALKDLPGVGGGLAGLGKDELDTEIGVLRSDRMLDGTIDALALTVQVRKPASNRALVLRARVIDSSDVDGKIVLSRRDGGSYEVESTKLDGHKLPATLAAGDSMRVGSVMIILPENLRAAGPGTIRLTLLPRYKVHEQLDKRLSIRKQEGGSRLVEVMYEDPDRRLAAQVVNHLVNEFVRYSLQTELRDESTQMEELRAALAKAGVRLGTAEERLRGFQQRSRIVQPEEQAGLQVKRIALLDTRIDAVRIERNALARLLDLIRQRARGGADPMAYRQLATFPSLISNGGIQDLLKALVDLETTRSTLAVTRTESNVEIQQLSARIADLDQQLYRLGSQYLESLDQQLASTASTVATLNDTLVALPATALQYARLERDRAIVTEEYLALVKQLKISELQELLRKEKVRVVDVPRVANPDDPAFPKRDVQLALGAILAIVFAFAAGLVAELWSEDEEPPGSLRHVV